MTDRREFLQRLAALAAAAPFGPVNPERRTNLEPRTSNLEPAAEDRIIGVQMGAHTMLDEGI